MCHLEVCPVMIEGRVSTFGGSHDKSSVNKTYFGHDITKDDTNFYCAILFPYKDAEKYRNKKIMVYNKKNDKVGICDLIDRGPSKWTKRSIDISPALFKYLELKTDEKVKYIVYEP